MTIFQLKIALAVKDLGSISSAAAELGVSQPNASNSIKLLESEIGFPVFKRSRLGISATEKGRYFLEHAGRMMKEHDSIMEIQKQKEIYRLRLGTPYYLDAKRPFLELCKQHRDDGEADFRYAHVSIKDGITKLTEFNLDIIFAPTVKSQIVGVMNACRQNGLILIHICDLPAVINLRKDHPAALDGRAKKITQGCDLMKEYPYIADRILDEDKSSTGYNDSDFIHSSYKMYADEVDIKRRIAACTNAFYFGMQPSKGVNEQYGTVSFLVPGVMMDVSCIVRNDDINKKEIQDYISLLRKELKPAAYR